MAALDEEQKLEIVQALRSHGIVYARLFGSAAKAALAFDSDVDLAVSAGRPLGSDRRYKLIQRIAEITFRPVDIIDLVTASGAIYDQALSGVELFCDDAAAKANAQYRRVAVVQDDIEYARATFEAAKDRMFLP
jgi:predicted nucleotidyltransferase